MEIGTDRSVIRIIVSFSFCFFLHSASSPPFLLLSLFLPQFRWIFIATVTIDLVEEFLLLHLISTLTGNDSIVWHERSLSDRVTVLRRSDSPLFFAGCKWRWAGYEPGDLSCRCFPPQLSRLLSNFIRMHALNPFVKIHLYNTGKKKPTSKLEYLSIVFFNLNHPKRRKKSMSWKMLFVSCRYLDSFSRYKLLKIKNIH